MPLLDYRWLPRDLEVEVFGYAELGGAPIARETVVGSVARWGGSPVPGLHQHSARLSREFVRDRSGTWRMGIASPGHGRLLLDGQLLVEHDAHGDDTRFSRGPRNRPQR